MPSRRVDEAEGKAGGAAPLAGERWNFNVLVVQGTFFDAARFLASPRLVLPFLYIALGAPVFFAGLLLPLVQFSRLVAQVVAAPVVKSSRTRKWYVMLCSGATASALTIIGFQAKTTAGFLIVTVFLLVAVVLGIFQGVNSLAFSDLLGRLFRQSRRSTLVYAQTAVAGIVAIAATWFAHNYFVAPTPLQNHLNLLWTGAGVMALAAILITIIREPLIRSETGDPTTASPDRKDLRNGYIAELRQGLRQVTSVGWFRRYAVARGLLLSVELAMPFYAIHSAALHSDKRGSLSAFVVATGLAVVVGGPIWRMLGQISQRYVMALGAAVTGMAGIWALVIEITPSLQHIIPHAFVFALVAIGTQGVVGARTVYLVDRAPDEDRPYYIAVSNTISGTVGVLVAFALGAIAHLQGVVWPVLLIVCMNLLAGIACIRLRETVAS